MIKRALSKPDWIAAVTAVLLAASTVVSYAFQTANSFAPLFKCTGTTALAVLALVALSAIAYVVLTIFFAWLDAEAPAHAKPAEPFKTILHKRFLVIFIIIYVCWLPWLISHYPGLVRDDTIRQMMQTYAIEPYSNGNPLFDTWVFGLFWHLGDALGNRALGLYIFGFVQAALTAASLSFMLCYLKKIGVPRALIVASLIAVSLLCIFPLAAMSMSKDSFNGWLFILFFTLFAELCRSHGAILRNKGYLLAFAVVVILLVATKKTMLYVVLLSFLAFIIFNKGTRLKCAAFLLPVLIVSSLFADTLMPRIMVNEAPVHAKTSTSAATTFILIPLQQTGRLLAEGVPLEQADLYDLGRFIDTDLTAEIYAPRRADEVVWATKDNTTTADRSAYLRAWMRLGFEYPLVYLEALTSQLFGWNSPYWKIGFGYDLSNDVFDPGHMQLWSRYFDNSEAAAREFLEPLNTSIPELSLIDQATRKVAGVAYDAPLVISFGLWCTWLPLIGLAYAVRKRNKQAVIALCVTGATLLSVLIGPMVLYWYAIPLFYTAPLALSVGMMKQGGVSAPTALTPPKNQAHRDQK